jgi:hypothetical protein
VTVTCTLGQSMSCLQLSVVGPCGASPGARSPYSASVTITTMAFALAPAVIMHGRTAVHMRGARTQQEQVNARPRARACMAPAFVVHSGSDEVDKMMVVFPFRTEQDEVRLDEEEEKAVVQEDAPWLTCGVCENSGFVPCRKCGATGMIRRADAVNVFYCGDCVGHKKIRCPSCGGRCYMCE